MHRERFPGVREGWARFDGPAGTQMVDTAIEAMADVGGERQQRQRRRRVRSRRRLRRAARADRASASATLLGASAASIVFGANMTTLTLAFTRAVAPTLRPGARVVGTRLDHDANVTPWRLACDTAGAEHVLAPFDPATGTLDPQAVIDLIDERTAWVTLPGASNLLGTVPDLAPIIAAAHDAGARVFVDAVHLAPHRRDRVVDARLRRPRHVAVQVVRPARRRAVRRPGAARRAAVAKVRPAPDRGPRRWETGTPSFEAIAAVEAAARFLLDEGLDRIAAGRGQGVRAAARGAAGDARRAGVGAADDGGPHADGRLHRRRPPPRRGRRGARR